MKILNKHNEVNKKCKHVLFLIKHIFWFLKNYEYGNSYYLFCSASKDHDKINKELYKRIMIKKIERGFNLIIQGNSNKGFFVYCFKCHKKFVWLKAKEVKKGIFKAICYKCRRKK